MLVRSCSSCRYLSRFIRKEWMGKWGRWRYCLNNINYYRGERRKVYENCKNSENPRLSAIDSSLSSRATCNLSWTKEWLNIFRGAGEWVKRTSKRVVLSFQFAFCRNHRTAFKHNICLALLSRWFKIIPRRIEMRNNFWYYVEREALQVFMLLLLGCLFFSLPFRG